MSLPEKIDGSQRGKRDMQRSYRVEICSLCLPSWKIGPECCDSTTPSGRTTLGVPTARDLRVYPHGRSSGNRLGVGSQWTPTRAGACDLPAWGLFTPR
ncbi:hypothetical protein EVAR_18066_1 [Eumeta japonica]|uniref:Uncharacterized protein n=1 Tax=Eumeta variegata TaxID=151549 RepID=A0A4C1VIR9_EUMVA|nr:hypothetical protein EVAR_18066_1 [Eumeta japonica]